MTFGSILAVRLNLCWMMSRKRQFRFVNSFLVTNSLPKCSKTGHIALNKATLKAVADQAKSFVLSKLCTECEEGLKDLRLLSSTGLNEKSTKECNVHIITPEALLVRSLRQLWRPLNLHGTLEKGQFAAPLFKKSSVDEVDLKALVSTANVIRFPLEPTHEFAFEIGSFLLNEKALEEVAKKIHVTALFPDRFVDLRPRKLQILCAGTSQHALTPMSGPSLGKEAVLGTVEVILNSAFSGGQLQVLCDDQSTDFTTTVPFSWAAVHADATCLINPVTSGARVSLIYDIVETVSPSYARTHDVKAYIKVGQPLVLFPHARFYYSDVIKLVSIAKHLPINHGSTNYFQIDGHLCNEDAVQDLVASMVDKAAGLFKRDVVVQANRLDIHLPGATFSRNTDDHPTHCGYLGSLVVILDNKYEGGEECLVINGKEERLYTGCRRAFIVPANSVHTLSDITNGARMSLVCDIFDKHMLHQHAMELDPLSLVNNSVNDNSGSDEDTDGDSDISDTSEDDSYHNNYDSDRNDDYDTDYYDTDSDGSDSDDATASTVNKPLPITRPRATPTTRKEICTGLSEAFEAYDAVIITLQDVLPNEMVSKLTDSVELQGGDGVLLDMLADNNDYDVELVKVTLQCKVDPATSKYVFSKASAAMEEELSTLLLVPTKVTSAHRVYDEESVYQVTGLKVTKRV